MHAAEGTDASAAAEIEELDRAGVLSSRTVLIHGVGIDCGSLETLRAAPCIAGLVPQFESLHAVSNAAAGGFALRPAASAWERTPRSPVKAIWPANSAWRAKPAALSAADIYPMVTTQAARMLRLNRGEGEIREHGIADLLAVPDPRTESRGSAPGILPGLGHSRRQNPTSVQRSLPRGSIPRSRATCRRSNWKAAARGL